MLKETRTHRALGHRRLSPGANGVVLAIGCDIGVVVRGTSPSPLRVILHWPPDKWLNFSLDCGCSSRWAPSGKDTFSTLPVSTRKEFSRVTLLTSHPIPLLPHPRSKGMTYLLSHFEEGAEYKCPAPPRRCLVICSLNHCLLCGEFSRAPSGCSEQTHCLGVEVGQSMLFKKVKTIISVQI